MIYDRDGNPAKRYIPAPRPACVAGHHDPKNQRVDGERYGKKRIVSTCCGRFYGYAEAK